MLVIMFHLSLVSLKNEKGIKIFILIHGSSYNICSEILPL